MGSNILRGVSSALVVTVITLLVGMFWSAMGYGGLNPSTLVDIGLVASCLTAGYRSGRESGVWFWGGIAALGYVGLSILLVALFLPISGWGALQILAVGGVIGILAGAFGAGTGLGKRTQIMGRNRSISSRPSHWGEEDNEWDTWNNWGRPSSRSQTRENLNVRESEEGDDFSTTNDGEWEEWMSGENIDPVLTEEDKIYKPNKVRGEKEAQWGISEKKVWWEEDVN